MLESSNGWEILVMARIWPNILSSGYRSTAAMIRYARRPLASCEIRSSEDLERPYSMANLVIIPTKSLAIYFIALSWIAWASYYQIAVLVKFIASHSADIDLKKPSQENRLWIQRWRERAGNSHLVLEFGTGRVDQNIETWCIEQFHLKCLAILYWFIFYG